MHFAQALEKMRTHAQWAGLCREKSIKMLKNQQAAGAADALKASLRDWSTYVLGRKRINQSTSKASRLLADSESACLSAFLSIWFQEASRSKRSAARMAANKQRTSLIEKHLHS